MAKTKPQPKPTRANKNTYKHECYEHNSGTTETVPNEAPSVREILFRNTQGLDYDNYKTPFYEEQATFTSQSLHEIQDMELVDKITALEKVSKQADDLRKQVEDYTKAQALAQREAFNKVNQTTNEVHDSEES